MLIIEPYEVFVEKTIRMFPKCGTIPFAREQFSVAFVLSDSIASLLPRNVNATTPSAVVMHIPVSVIHSHSSHEMMFQCCQRMNY